MCQNVGEKVFSLGKGGRDWEFIFIFVQKYKNIMASAVIMDGIWALIESLSLTNRNKKWLSDKLLASIPSKKTVRSKEDQEILDGFREAVLELREIKAGRAQTTTDEEFMAEIRKEIAEGVYDHNHGQ